MSLSVSTAPLVKPRLRGVFHQLAILPALIAGAWLVREAPSARAAHAALIYALTLVGLYSISATYHRPTWTPVARERMQRLDHSAIYLLIAGSYTPMCLALSPEHARVFSTICWGAAGLGILRSLFWPHAPKVLVAVLYIAFGWIGFAYFPEVYRRVGFGPLALLAGGGVVYSLGGVIYAARKPNPWPRVFGYHEFFHLFVIVASVVQFVSLTEIINRAG